MPKPKDQDSDRYRFWGSYTSMFHQLTGMVLGQCMMPCVV